MRIVVTGGTGFLGRHLVRHAAAAGMSVLATCHSQCPDAGDAEWVRLDLGNSTQIDDLIARSGADAIVHTAAALSASLRPLAANLNWRVNAVSPVEIARAAHRHGLRMVFISSDALFAGRDQAYTESDMPDPVYPYGAAKAAAELGIATVLPQAALLRVSLIYGDGGELAKRERHILDLAAGRARGAYLTDAVRCPVGVNDLARACLELAANDYAGVLNVAGPEAITLYELARVIAGAHGFDPDRIPGATRADLGNTRPGRVVLDTTRARDLLRTPLRAFREVVA